MFKKAERKQAKLKLALTGPSGSGKTYSALRMAKGISQSIALIDTENHSASLYADTFNFDVLEITPPYTTHKYIQAIKAAEDNKYEVIIVDSISHQWAGEGGILNQKEKMDSRGGNSYTNWGKLTPEQERFKSTLLQCKSHLICTIRSKQDYVMESNDRGKQAPKKVGLAPIQRDGMEYEFTVVLDIAIDHSAKASKDRTKLFTNERTEDVFIITEETGEKLKNWINSGVKEIEWKMSVVEANKIFELAGLVGSNAEMIQQRIRDRFKKEMDDVTEKEFHLIVETLKKESQSKVMQ